MLARLQKFITLGLLFMAFAWAVWNLKNGSPTWAVVGALLIVFGYALILGMEFMLLWWVHGNDPTPKAGARALFRAWFGEALAAPRVFCWQQPFRSNAVPDFVPAQAKARGVVLVHGFVCNRGFWNRWMPRLKADGIPFVAVNLEPVFGTISDYAQIIEQAVRRLEVATGQPPVIVAHSMGGMAVRAWIAQHQGDERVLRVITIGSPHHGTWLGRFGMSRNSREMHLRSEWRTKLEEHESPGRFARFTCFYSHCDNIVFPASIATLPGADNRHLPGVAHVDMANRSEVWGEALTWLVPEVASGARE